MNLANHAVNASYYLCNKQRMCWTEITCHKAYYFRKILRFKKAIIDNIYAEYVLLIQTSDEKQIY